MHVAFNLDRLTLPEVKDFNALGDAMCFPISLREADQNPLWKFRAKDEMHQSGAASPQLSAALAFWTIAAISPTPCWVLRHLVGAENSSQTASHAAAAPSSQ